MADEANGADVAVEIAGQKVNLRNVKSLNTLATVLTMIIVCVLSYIVFAHAGDSKEGSKEVATILKESNKEVANALKDSNRELGIILREMTQAAREQNCLMRSGVANLQPEKRQEVAELCKQLSR